MFCTILVYLGSLGMKQIRAVQKFKQQDVAKSMRKVEETRIPYLKDIKDRTIDTAMDKNRDRSQEGTIIVVMDLEGLNKEENE